MNIQVVVEVATVHDHRIQNLSISHDNVVYLLRNHGGRATILGIHCSLREQG